MRLPITHLGLTPSHSEIFDRVKLQAFETKVLKERRLIFACPLLAPYQNYFWSFYPPMGVAQIYPNHPLSLHRVFRNTVPDNEYFRGYFYSPGLYTYAHKFLAPLSTLELNSIRTIKMLPKPRRDTATKRRFQYALFNSLLDRTLYEKPQDLHPNDSQSLYRSPTT
ncbi:hypothetical protein BDQ17DRAFT_495059 [Cyathus striatus]|nr:hypothetical protein BDQ17DRAFT_495059 [Cyathus striatus]